MGEIVTTVNSLQPLTAETVNFLQPYLRYQGGKHKIAPKIVKLFPKHEVYVEPMAGGARVFFAKEPALKEVISDADTDLMRFYKALKSGETNRCDLTPNKEKLKRIVKKAKGKGKLSPCEYLYRNKISYGGKGTTPDPGAFVKCAGDKAKTCGIASKNHLKYRERLKKTVISSGDFSAVCKKHDGAKTLFYIDPPYPNTSTEGYHHGRDLMPADVRKVTDSLKGMVVLSYNNIPLVRKEFCRGGKYKCRTIKQEYTLNNTGEHKAVTELIITKGI